MDKRLLTLGFALAAVGCGGDASFETRTHDIAAAYCAHVFDCAAGNLDAFQFTMTIGTEQRCADYLSQELFSNGQTEAIQTAIHQGTIRYDDHAASQCVAAVRAVDNCAQNPIDVLGTTQACDQVLVGTVAQGGACTLDEECLDGLSCDIPGNTCAGGTCQPSGGGSHTVTAGMPCTSDSACAWGLSCVYDATALADLCKTVTFEATGTAGVPCRQQNATMTTVDVVTCTTGLGCIYDLVDDRFECGTPLAQGATCHDGETCVDGTICLPDGGSAMTSSCQPVSFVRNAGDVCTDLGAYAGGPITFCDHARGLYCDTTGHCVALGNGTSGTVCASPDAVEDKNQVLCRDGLFCDENGTDTCQPKRAAGVSCQRDKECLSDLCLNQVCTDVWCAN